MKKKDMKNKSFLMISVIMVCSLTACGQQETGIMTKTGNSTEQVVASGDNSELATAEDNNMEQTEAKEQEVVQFPDEPSMDDSSSSTEKFENKDNWPDVEELVNQRGDETTVYLLADIFLTLFHNLWFKGLFLILWDFDFHRTIPTVYLLMFIAVAIIIVVRTLGLFVSKVIIHFGLHHFFNGAT